MNQQIIHNKFHRLFFFLIIFCSFLSPFAHSAQQESPQPEKKGLLWHSQDGGKTIYLLGSIHILTSGSYPLPKEIEEAYDNSGTVVFETDIDGMKRPEMQALVMEMGLLEEGQTLETTLSKKTYSVFKSKIESLGLSVVHFKSFKPWFAAIAIIGMEFQRLGFDPMYGIDNHFYRKAKKDGKEILFLEPLEAQLKLLGLMTIADQESFLLQTLKEIEVVKEMMSQMVDAWQKGNAGKLNSIMQISFKDYPNLYDRLITIRNREWKKQITEFAGQKDSIMIVVGAGHLLGPDGLVEMLVRDGYKIEKK